MSANTISDRASATIEVRIYRHHQLLARETCAGEENVAVVVDRWSDVANLFVVADIPTVQLDRSEVTAPELLDAIVDEELPIAYSELPSRGTE